MIEQVEAEAERLENEVHKARRTDKRQKWWLFTLSMLLMVTLAVIGILLMQTQDRAEKSEGVAVAEQAEKKQIAQEARQVLCGTGDREIYDRELCAKWAEAAQEPVAAPMDDGPSREEIVSAFRAYCAEGDNCKGRDGATPTPDDIAAAFGRFCADGKCTGPAGKDGADGADGEPLAPEYDMVLAAVTEVCATGVCTGPAGKDGVNGADGANATPEMVLAAVQTYCADDACRGPAGPPGADSTVPGPKGDKGDIGAQGISITDVDCVGEGSESTWQITLSDGQVLNGGGPCKVAVVGPPVVPGPVEVKP